MKLSLLGGLLSFLGQEDGLDVGQDTALSDGHAGQQPVQLLVVPDGQLQVARDDARLLVVLGGVSGQLEDLGGKVPEKMIIKLNTYLEFRTRMGAQSTQFSQMTLNYIKTG